MPALLESLESRRLLSVSLTKGALLVRGDAKQGNAISIGLSGDSSMVVVTLNGVQTTYAASAVSKIAVLGGAKADVISINTSMLLGASIVTGAGDDTVFGGNAASVIDAGAGNDTVTVGSGRNRIATGAGNDAVTAGDGRNYVDAGAGNDSVTCGNGGCIILGGAGDDAITCGSGDDRISAGAGNDTVSAGDGNNIVRGDAGNDAVTAGSGNDLLHGGAGNDRLFGNGGDDTIFGGAGDDTEDGGAGSNDIWGFAGKNALTASPADAAQVNTYHVGPATTISPAARDGIDIVKSKVLKEASDPATSLFSSKLIGL